MGIDIVVNNVIAQALLDRVHEAIRESRKFRVVVVMPEMTESGLNSVSNPGCMLLQYETISRCCNSMLAQFQQRYPDKAFSDYIMFASLRTYGYLPYQTLPSTNMIYVHSKMMIVDDRYTIIGSANINDRSMLGDRDSELAVVCDNEIEGAGSGDVNDTSGGVAWSLMAGVPYRAGQFSHSLRMSLWNEHAGLPENDTSLMDVHDDATWARWLSIAHNNTRIYNSIWWYLPRDDIKTVDQYWSMPLTANATTAHMVSSVQGHLVEFPLYFLGGEAAADLWPRAMSPWYDALT